MARELHDAVAHSMTVVVLQAGAAQRLWGARPGPPRGASTRLGRYRARDARRPAHDARTQAGRTAAPAIESSPNGCGRSVSTSAETRATPRGGRRSSTTSPSAWCRRRSTNAARHAARDRGRVAAGAATVV